METNHQMVDKTEALKRLWLLAQADHGGAMVVRKFLLGLYNGTRFPFDLTELRRLDYREFEDCMLVLRLDSRCVREVHEWLNALFGRRDVGPRLELLAYDARLKGAVKRAAVPDLRERITKLARVATA